jgi:NAD(P)-dependent dehydrogenase (short-subunit alcohol dehydrogenase family)
MRLAKQVGYDFRDQVVLVTGAARGMGRSHALSFAECGATVVACDIAAPLETVPYDLASEEQLEAVGEEARALGAKCLTQVCDVRDGVQVKAAVDRALAEYGRIDVLVNNAGIESAHWLAEMPEQAWDEMLDTQLRGTFLCARQVAPQMAERGRGKIVTIGSVAAVTGVPRQVHYTAAKHGQLGFTRAFAIEMAPYGVNVNLVCPTGVDTPMVHGMVDQDAAWMEKLASVTGAWNLLGDGGLLRPQDITEAVLWLSSDAADAVTGVALMVDGGFSAK